MSEANSTSALSLPSYAIVSGRDWTLMTYDRRHILAQWGGTLPGGEIWSNSLRMASDETGPAAAVPTHQELVTWCSGPAKTAVQNFHQAADTYVSSAAKLAYLKMNVVDQAGHYVENNTIEHVFAPVVSGYASANPPPNQITLCVSLTTEFSRGPAHRGRFYLPLPGFGVDATTGVVSAGSIGVVATSAAAFIEALADEPGLDVFRGMRVCVMSKIGSGSTNVVTGVDVGRVLDTQRRRRAELPESYQHAVVDQGAD